MDYRPGLLANSYGLPIKGYWQTVTVCQLEVIGRPFAKYVNDLPISSYWQTPDTLTKEQLLPHCSKLAATHKCLSFLTSYFFSKYQGLSLKARGQGVILRVGCYAPLNQVINKEGRKRCKW